MSNRLENQVNERTAWDTDGGKITELLASLPRVEAPPNFDFGVKAKIAAAKATEPRLSIFSFAKVAAPLALVLVVAAAGFYFGLFSGEIHVADNPTVPASEQKLAQTIDETQTSSAPSGVSGLRIDEPVVPSPELVSVPPQKAPVVRSRNANNRSNTRVDGPLMVDRTLGTANVILPPGFQSVNPDKRSPIGGANEVPLRDVIGILGITAEFAGGGWKVRSIASNSTAERSGVRTDDVLEAMDGQALTEKTSFKGAFSPKALRVRREGKSVDIELRNVTPRPDR